MLGLMQDWPLLCHRIIDHAAIQHCNRPVITRSVEGPIERTTYGQAHDRARRLSNALIALGLARYGMKTDVIKIFQGLFEAASHMDLRRLPELFCGFPWRRLNAPTLYPVACIPQAWASATVFALVQASLGIGFDQGAGEIRFDRPVLPAFLDELHLRGLQTKHGFVDVLLRRHGSDVALNITRRQGNVPIVVLR